MDFITHSLLTGLGVLISREITSKLLTFESYLSSQSSLRLSVSNCPSGLGLLFDVSAEAVTVVYEAMDQGKQRKKTE